VPRRPRIFASKRNTGIIHAPNARLRGRPSASVPPASIGGVYAAVAPDGRLVVIGLQGGASAELNLGALLPKRASVAAIGLRGRPVEGRHGKAALCADVVARLWPMFGDGRVKPVVHARVPLADAALAHQMVEAGGVVGKILLTTGLRAD